MCVPGGWFAPICKHNARMIGLMERLHEGMSIDGTLFFEASSHG